MSHIADQQNEITATLVATVETNVLFDDEGMDTRMGQNLTVHARNTGAAAIQTVTLYRTVRGVEIADATNYGPIPAGVKKRLSWGPVDCDSARLTMTSAAGTTVAVTAILSADD